MERAQLKAMAKAQIKGNIGILFVIILIIALLSSAANVIPVIGSLVISSVLSVALCAIYLNLTGGKKPELNDLFSKFGQILPATIANFLVGLFTMLWSLLFFIPGIVKGLSYSMTNYILAENPDISGLEAINRSKAMMNGHKMDLFILQLSFIGWHLLGGITLGIAYIWILPYMSATVANFYNSINTSA